MANPNIRVDVDGNTAKLRRQIDDIAKTPLVLNIQSAGGSAAPLGRITGQLAELDKSLAASNARVVAFAASASAIYGIQSAVKAVFDSFVNVEKKLTDINVLLNASSANIAAFGSALFDIAGNTAQSFDTVAEAATELARQGLGIEETLRRTSDALTLTRLSGLDAAASVSALTAAINSFGSSALDSSEIVNKLASVDAAFAVSSADLANALSRVGSSAADAGISFDELIALVTTAQQVTARGGSVIGNSLKTIFTRLGREQVQGVLGDLGISATDESGATKSQIQLLQELASVYDTLSATQKNYVAEQVGGVFQINVLKAALGDLGKEYSIYDQALRKSVSATDEAYQKQEKLNKTLAARGAKTAAGLQEAGANIGAKIFGPAASNVLNITDMLTGAVNDTDSTSIGAKIGRGVMSGIGNFIGGPGLALVTAAIVKMFSQFSKYGIEAFKSIMGVNQAAKEQAAVQQSVIKFLQSEAGLFKSIVAGQTSATAAANAYLSVIKLQTQELQKQSSVAAQVAKAVSSKVGVQTVGGKQYILQKGKTTTAASGYMPDQIGEAYNISKRVGGANPATDKPVTIKNFPFGGGKRGAITAHTGEWAIPNYGGGDGTAIWNKDMKNKYGLPDGARKISASGFIPNFASQKKAYPSGIISGRQSAVVANENLDTYSPFSLELISIGSKAAFQEKFNTQLNNLTSSDYKLSGNAFRYFQSNGYSLNQISQLKQNLLSNAKKVPSLLSRNSGFVNKAFQIGGVKNDIIGKSFEKFAAKSLGLQQSTSSQARLDLMDKSGKPVAEVKFGRYSTDNIVSKIIDTRYGKQFKQRPPKKDNILMPSDYKLVVPNAASGFIPNFAINEKLQQENLTTPTVSISGGGMIYGKEGGITNTSQQITYPPGTKQQVNVKFRKSGYNVKNAKSKTFPDIKKQVGDVLVNAANDVGSFFGGNFKYSDPNQLPNAGSIGGALGNVWEGALRTLVSNSLQKMPENAGIDFKGGQASKLSPYFNNITGDLEAKYTDGSALEKDAARKFLQFGYAKVPKKAEQQTGYKPPSRSANKAMKVYQELRAKYPNLKGVEIRKLPEYKSQIATSGAAAGFIPNFAKVLDSARDRAIKTEKKYGQGAILDSYRGMEYVRQKNQSSNFNKMIKEDHPEGLKQAIKNSAISQGIMSGGFIPNFALNTDDAADSGSGATDFAAITASISSLLFSLAFFGGALDENAKSLSKLKKEIATSGKSFDDVEYENRQRLQKSQATLKKLDVQEAALLKNPKYVDQGTGTFTPEGAKKSEMVERRRQRIQAYQQRAEQRQQTIDLFRERKNETRGEKFGRFAEGKGLAAGFALQALGGVVSEFAGGERTGIGAGATALGNIGGFAGMGAMVGASFGGAGALPGAIIGGLVGAAVSAKPVMDALTTSIYEMEKAAEASGERAQLAADQAQAVSVSRQAYEDVTNDPKSSPQKIAKANQQYMQSLGKLPQEYVKQYLAAGSPEEAQEVLGKYMESTVRKANIDKLTSDLESKMNATFSTPTKNEGKSLAQGLLDAYGIGGVGSKISTPEAQEATYLNLQKVVDNLRNNISSLQNSSTMEYGGLGDAAAKTKMINDVLTQFESTIDLSTEEGKQIMEGAKSIRQTFENMDPNAADFAVVLEQLSMLLKGSAESAAKIKEAMAVRAQKVSNLSKEEQDFINNYKKNQKQYDQRAELVGNLNKIKRINTAQLGLDLSQTMSNALIQNRNLSGKDQLKYTNANIDLSKNVRKLEISNETLDVARKAILEQLQKDIDNVASNTSAQDPGLLKKLDALKKKLIESTTFEDIQAIDLKSIFGNSLPQLQEAWKTAISDGAQSLRLAMQNLNFDTEAAKLKAALDVAVAKYTERIQKMQSFGGGVEGLINYEGNESQAAQAIQSIYQGFEDLARQAAQSEKNYKSSSRKIKEQREDLQAAYDYGDIGPREYQRGMQDLKDQEDQLNAQKQEEEIQRQREAERLNKEMAEAQKQAKREEMQKSLERIKAVDALGLPDDQKEALMQQLLPDLQQQAATYLNDLGLGGLSGIGAANAEDMLRSMFGLQGNKDWKNPYNKQAEDDMKKAADLSKYMDEIIKKLDPLAESASKADEAISNLAACAQDSAEAMCPSNKDDKKPEDKKSEDKKSEDKKQDDKKPDDKKPDDKKPDDKKDKKDEKDTKNWETIKDVGSAIIEEIRNLGGTICECLANCCPGNKWSESPSETGAPVSGAKLPGVGAMAGGAGGAGGYGEAWIKTGDSNFGQAPPPGMGYDNDGRGGSYDYLNDPGLPPGFVAGSPRNAQEKQIYDAFRISNRGNGADRALAQIKQNWPDAEIENSVAGGTARMPNDETIMFDGTGRVTGLMGNADVGMGEMNRYVYEKYLTRNSVGEKVNPDILLKGISPEQIEDPVTRYVKMRYGSQRPGPQTSGIRLNNPNATQQGLSAKQAADTAVAYNNWLNNKSTAQPKLPARTRDPGSLFGKNESALDLLPKDVQNTIKELSGGTKNFADIPEDNLVNLVTAVNNMDQENFNVTDAFQEVLKMPNPSGKEQPVFQPSSFEAGIRSFASTGQQTPSMQQHTLRSLAMLSDSPETKGMVDELLKSAPPVRNPSIPPTKSGVPGIGGSTRYEGYMGEPNEAWVGTGMTDYMSVLRSAAAPDSIIGTTPEKRKFLKDRFGRKEPNKLAKEMLSRLDVNKDMTVSTEEASVMSTQIQSLADSILGDGKSLFFNPEPKSAQESIDAAKGIRNQQLYQRTPEYLAQEAARLSAGLAGQDVSKQINTYPATLPSSVPMGVTPNQLLQGTAPAPFSWQQQGIKPPINAQPIVPQQTNQSSPLLPFGTMPGGIPGAQLYNQKPPNQQPFNLQQPIINPNAGQPALQKQSFELNKTPNFQAGQGEMQKLVSSLDNASQAVQKQTSETSSNTESLKSSSDNFQTFGDSFNANTPQQNNGIGAGAGGAAQGFSINMPITTNLSPQISVGLAEDAINQIQGYQVEMQEALKTEIQSAVDGVNRQIAQMNTKTAQTQA